VLCLCCLCRPPRLSHKANKAVIQSQLGAYKQWEGTSLRVWACHWGPRAVDSSLILALYFIPRLHHKNFRLAFSMGRSTLDSPLQSVNMLTISCRLGFPNELFVPIHNANQGRKSERVTSSRAKWSSQVSTSVESQSRLSQ
jgi:hypothetical protein